LPRVCIDLIRIDRIDACRLRWWRFFCTGTGATANGWHLYANANPIARTNGYTRTVAIAYTYTGSHACACDNTHTYAHPYRVGPPHAKSFAHRDATGW
jgi:hypothetical protein